MRTASPTSEARMPPSRILPPVPLPGEWDYTPRISMSSRGPDLASPCTCDQFFSFRQAVEDSAPPILRVLDANKQFVGAHRSQKHNLQHVYATEFAIFRGKNCHFLVKN